MAFQFPANPVLNQQFTPLVGVTYVWNGTGWAMIGPTPASMYPPAFVVPYAGAAPLPFQGWLLCDGASYLAADYAGLFAVIGYTYGGAGANFNVPDLRGRVVAGKDDMGGTAANRITTGASGVDGATRGAAGGSQVVALVTGEMPAHAHSVTDTGHSHGVNDPGHFHTITNAMMFNGGGYAAFSNISGPANPNTDTKTTGITVIGALTGVTLQNTGGGAAHQNVQPSMILNYIIKT